MGSVKKEELFLPALIFPTNRIIRYPHQLDNLTLYHEAKEREVAHQGMFHKCLTSYGSCVRLHQIWHPND